MTTTTAHPTLSAQHLSVHVDGTTLLDGVSLRVDEGSWLSIIGPNGAGKSTLLRALAGSIDSVGTVDVQGRALQAIPRRERARLVSWVPQTPTIPRGMHVLDYVLLGRNPHLRAFAVPSNVDVDRCREILNDLDLLELADRTVDTLSGGERQRAVIGRALAQEAPILLLDEPTSALDLGHQQDVLRLLDRLRTNFGRTIISTMHDLTLAGQFADRLVLLANGSIVAEGPAVDVLTEQNLKVHYRADVKVTRHGDSVLVVPRIDPPDSTQDQEHLDAD